jgi:hypothetical protein
MATAVALSHKNMISFIMKFIRERELALFATHLLFNKAYHSKIILNIFFNLLCIGFKLEQLDNAFSSLNPAKIHTPKEFKTIFCESKFLEVCFSLLSTSSQLKREKCYLKEEALSRSLTEFFKKILRANSEQELEKCKVIIESKMDLLISNMEDYSEEESNILFGLFEGGEYLDLRPGTYAKSIDGKNIIIVGFANSWFDLSSKNNEESYDFIKNSCINTETSENSNY